MLVWRAQKNVRFKVLGLLYQSTVRKIEALKPTFTSPTNRGNHTKSKQLNITTLFLLPSTHTQMQATASDSLMQVLSVHYERDRVHLMRKKRRVVSFDACRSRYHIGPGVITALTGLAEHAPLY